MVYLLKYHIRSPRSSGKRKQGQSYIFSKRCLLKTRLKILYLKSHTKLTPIKILRISNMAYLMKKCYDNPNATSASNRYYQELMTETVPHELLDTNVISNNSTPKMWLLVYCEQHQTRQILVCLTFLIIRFCGSTTLSFE